MPGAIPDKVGHVEHRSAAEVASGGPAETAVMDRVEDEPQVPGPAPSDVAASVPARPGPPVLREDSWDELPDQGSENNLYQGRRRATLRGRRVLIIVALLVGVGAVFGVPMLLSGSNTPRSEAPPGSIVAGDSALGGGAPTIEDTGELVSAASSPGARRSSSPTTAAEPGSSSSTAASPSGGPSAPATSAAPSSSPTTFAMMTLQAENTSGLSAWQRETGVCANATAIQTGRWSSSHRGKVVFSVSVAAAGAYKVTIYTAPSSGKRAEILVNNASQTSPDFPNVCATRVIQVNLKSGSNEIVFQNQNDHGPTIDRIEITRA